MAEQQSWFAVRLTLEGDLSLGDLWCVWSNALWVK
jgi:hypothetical protein